MTSTFILGILGGLGTTEVIVILVIVLLLFGGKKIPELMKGLGRGVKDFKDPKLNRKLRKEDMANTRIVYLFGHGEL